MGRDGESFGKWLRRELHLGKSGRPEQMVVEILHVQRIHGLSCLALLRVFPGRKVGISLVPGRDGQVHIHLLPGTGHIISLNNGQDGAVGRILDAFPAFVRIEIRRFGLPLQEETGRHGNL